MILPTYIYENNVKLSFFGIDYLCIRQKNRLGIFTRLKRCHQFYNFILLLAITSLLMLLSICVLK